MPHAALLVVQGQSQICMACRHGVSMPHAALLVVQDEEGAVRRVRKSRFNAARGFVGGASRMVGVPRSGRSCFNAARGFVGGASPILLHLARDHCKFQCRTRLCWWCKMGRSLPPVVFRRFNAARGFVGGARPLCEPLPELHDWFQCRTRLCWWCKNVAHSPCISCVQRLFWKVSGCLRWLSERMQNTYSNTTSLSGAIPCAISPCHAHGRNGKSRRCSAALQRPLRLSISFFAPSIS